jgi:hypothetical protein
MSGSDTTDNIARMHELHGLQPVLPVADVSASAPLFEEVLGFEVEFLHGAGSSRTRASRRGMAATVNQSSFISATPSPNTFSQAESCAARARLSCFTMRIL